MTRLSHTPQCLLVALLIIAGGCSDDIAATADGGADLAADLGADSAPQDQQANPDNAAKPDQAAKLDQQVKPDQAALPDAGMSCAAMVQAFAAARKDAKRCTQGKQQCTTKAVGSIYPMCQCPTFINATKTAALAKMKQLQAQFMAAKCTGPACKCANPIKAACEVPSGSTEAQCVDKLQP